MDSNNTIRFVPRWKLNKKPLPSKLQELEKNLSVSTRILWSDGALLLIIGAIILALLLSGCQPVVIRQACDQYPLPPPDLMQPPLNERLVPSNVRPSPTTPSSMPRN